MTRKHDLYSLTEFKRNPSRLCVHLKQTGKPVILTIQGKPALVIQDAKAYQTLLDLIEKATTLESLREGLNEMRSGLGRTAHEVFGEIRRDLNLESNVESQQTR